MLHVIHEFLLNSIICIILCLVNRVTHIHIKRRSILLCCKSEAFVEMYILKLEKVTSGPEQLTYVYQVGEHVLGRGPELQCTSKKVSRKHALLKVTENDGVFLESTHNNPCYHQSKNTQSIQIISFSKSIKLNNEDKIALALEHGWFTAKITRSNNEDASPSDIIKNKRELDNNEASEAKKIKLNDTNNENISELQVDDVEMTANNDVVEAEETAKDEVTVKNEPLNMTENSVNIDSNTEIKQEPLDESMNEPEVKQEPVNTSETAIKDEPEDDAKNNEKQDKCATNSNDPSSASTSLGNGPRRDRCWYGSTCYRKNPTHRATFSHPNDTDYDSDPNDTRAICCYGINCYRRNKLHREKYRHPGQDKIPDPPSKKKRKQQKTPKTNETRKRKTKANTVDYYDDEEDDYDLDDPFINDGDSSDEYEPESSDTESDEEESSQSQNTEEQEDTKQLLKDARKFTRRK